MEPQPDDPAQSNKRPSRLPMPRSGTATIKQSALTSLARPTNASSARAAAIAPTVQKPRLASTFGQRTVQSARNSSAATPAAYDGFKRPQALSRANLELQPRKVSGSSLGSTTREDDQGSMYSFRSDATISTAATAITDVPHTPCQSQRKGPRPSLTQRTIESLSQIEATPGSARRQSNFFSPESPRMSRPRPASSTGGRPNSQEGNLSFNLGRTPRTFGSKPSLSNLNTSRRTTPGKYSTVSAKTSRARSPTKASLLKSVPMEKENAALPKAVPRTTTRGSKTVTGRIQQPRGSLSDLFGGELRKPVSAIKPSTIKAGPFAGPFVEEKVGTLAVKEAVKEDNGQSPKPFHAAKTSALLREQIRAAKAARLSSGRRKSVDAATGFDASHHDDPFKIKPKDADERSLIRRRVDMARADGRLNISAMGLKEFPGEVLKMYDYEYNKDSSLPWNEVVDLTRLIAADNELDSIPDAVFPDPDDPETEPMFGGIEVLDLRGNNLFDVPGGFKFLRCLTTLNLSRNRLMNDALETIARISSLRELKMADNLLTGELTFVESLTSLEVLDVSSNKLSALPTETRELTKLRHLDVSNNQLTDLPMTELASMPLVELYASKNKLTGALFKSAGTRMVRLTMLDVSVNQLTSLYNGNLGPDFPALNTLNIAFNAITSLPDISGWANLTSLVADSNRIQQLPLGFTESTSLRSVDLSGNDLTRIDDGISTMEALDVFKIAGNPLRQRRFLSMGTAELKKALAERAAPVGFGF